jgi:Ni/Co efflux regulator RcnB
MALRLVAWSLLAVMLAAAPAPPALAGPPGCPPGHAKKGWCDDGRRWHVGDRVADDRVVVIRARGGLPRPSKGEVWVEVDDEVLLIALATGLVLDVWRED